MENRTEDTLPSFDTLLVLPASHLKSLYQRLMGTPPPKRASAAFLRGNIAWVIQARAMKKDPATLRATLLKKACRHDIDAKPRIGPGTRLIREWQGTVHEVLVLEKGLFWNGKTYGSLTQVAAAITGSHWSGPRFFGIRSQSR